MRRYLSFFPSFGAPWREQQDGFWISLDIRVQAVSGLRGVGSTYSKGDALLSSSEQLQQILPFLLLLLPTRVSCSSPGPQFLTVSSGCVKPFSSKLCEVDSVCSRVLAFGPN